MKKGQNQNVKSRLRSDAEKVYKKKAVTITEESDNIRLLQELSVHQIELELQNEELQSANREAEKLAQKYTELYDFAPTGYYTLSKEGKIIELNLQGAKFLGRERSLAVKSSFEFFLATESKKPFTDFFKKLTSDKKSLSCEASLQNGTCLLLSGSIVDEKFMLSASDITVLKTAQKENEKLLKDLEYTDKKLKLALQNAGIASWELNVEKKEIHVDDRMAEMLGMLRRPMIMNVSEFEKIVHEQDIRRFNKDVHRSIEKNIPLDIIFRVVIKNEHIRFVNLKALLSLDENSGIHNLIGVGIDVTSMHESSGESLLKLNEELSRSNSELENFAYVASHDLQEPLRMVASFTQLLENQYGDQLDEKAHEYMDFAIEGAKRMYDLLNSLLTYSRIQTKGVEFEYVNVNDVLKKVKENLRIVINERGAIVENDNLPVVFADGNQMIQLFQNLIENGIKFSNQLPRIQITSKRNKGYHIISVRDNGIGIEKIYFERIFRIFQRLHNKDDYPGTGIGLAICRSIVERHGGTIWVDSSPGNGTEFFFTLPEKAKS
ncbi:MAG: ATP-binding protein [Chloroflexota bacterium]